MATLYRTLVCVVLALLATACGGGGDGNGDEDTADGRKTIQPVDPAASSAR